jgi:hypothetical protein
MDQAFLAIITSCYLLLISALALGTTSRAGLELSDATRGSAIINAKRSPAMPGSDPGVRPPDSRKSEMRSHSVLPLDIWHDSIIFDV